MACTYSYIIFYCYISLFTLFAVTYSSRSLPFSLPLCHTHSHAHQPHAHITTSLSSTLSPSLSLNVFFLHTQKQMNKQNSLTISLFPLFSICRFARHHPISYSASYNFQWKRRGNIHLCFSCQAPSPYLSVDLQRNKFGQRNTIFDCPQSSQRWRDCYFEYADYQWCTGDW